MTTFDPIKAIKEEITGLAEVAKAIRVREAQLEGRLGEAEADLNNIRKISGFAQMELQRKRDVLRQLEDEAERKNR